MTHYFVGNRVYFFINARKHYSNINYLTIFSPKIKWSFSAKAKKSSLHIHSDKYGSHRYDIYSTSNNKSIETVVSLNAFRGLFYHYSVTYKVTEEHSPKYIINTEKQNKWFMTKWFGNFLFSENRNEYIRIAFEYNSTPWRVYNLAHRSKARSRKEERILMELKERGIITVIRLF